MPKQEIDGEELFNLAMSIVGIVLRDGIQDLASLAKHFDYSEKTIKRAVLTIGNSEDVGKFRTHFYLDDELLEAGEVDFSQADAALSEPPVLSKRQSTSLAAGLDYLASLPQFAANSALETLRDVLGGATPAAITKIANEREIGLLTQLQKAVLDKMAIECEYVNQVNERGVRTIDPLRIDFVSDKHYLRGYCHKNQAVRSFRLDRIISVTPTSIEISQAALDSEIPEEVFGSVQSEMSVTIAAQPEAAEIFWNFPSYSQVQSKDGELIGQIMVGSLQALGRHITRYAGLVRVIEPAEAVGAVREFASRSLSAAETPGDED